jgi:SAM-dependent methyltransferase
MADSRQWQSFFDAHAPAYMSNCFVGNTLREVDFLIETLRLAPGARILDIGCGTGRHSVELARRGYAMTGVDLSPGMLAEARKAARDAGVNVEWIQGDATQLDVPGPFDAAICLCEGSFGLLESGDDALEHPLSILRGTSRSLKAGGRCLFTVLSALRLIRSQTDADVAAGRFDPLTLSTLGEMPPTEGAAPIPRLRERGFVPTELVLLFRAAGLAPLHIWGGTAGSWNRGPVGLDEFEIMILAEKPAGGP